MRRRRRGLGFPELKHSNLAMSYYNEALHSAQASLESSQEGRCHTAFTKYNDAALALGRAVANRQASGEANEFEIATRRDTAVTVFNDAEREFRHACIRK